MTDAAQTLGVESLEAKLRSRFHADEAEAMIAFARALFARTGAAYAAELGDKECAALVAGAFRFFARMTAPVRCRIWTPTVAVDGWDAPYTVLESHLTDRPFVVDTIRELLHKQRISVRHLLHPIFSVERDRDGSLVRLRSLGASAQRESFVHAALDKVADAELPRLQAELEVRLGDVFAVTEDYRPMRERLDQATCELESLRPRFAERAAEIGEVCDFLRWLGSGNFVFLGYRAYRLAGDGHRPALEVDEGSNLGLLRRTQAPVDSERQDWGNLPASAGIGGPLLYVSRTNAESPVHRAVRMDSICVQRLDEMGRTNGFDLFLGLFTSKAYGEESAEVPVLRQKLREILEGEQVIPESHDYKSIISIFDTIPKSELFSLPVTALRADVRAILAAEGSDTVRVHLWPGAGGRGLTVMVILHRDRFSGEIRRKIEELLQERFGAAVVDYQLALGEGERARLHFYLGEPASAAGVRVEDLEKQIAECVRSWEDRLRERLLAQFPGAAGRDLAERYTPLFTPEYKASTEVDAAVADIRAIERLARPIGTEVDLTNEVGGDAERFTLLKLYLRGESIVLSDFLPMLENLGLRVFAEDSVTLGENGDRVFLHRFRVQDRRGQRLDVGRVAPLVSAAILEILAGRADNDSLNRLIVDAGLDWREGDLLRTYRNLAFQTGAGPSRPALGEVWLKHPDSARALLEIFAARFEPNLPEREERAGAARERFLKTLESVETSSEDRMLHNYLALVDGTLRANFYRPPRPDHPYLCLKIHSQKIDFFPRPRPLYEIYVHSARMEGVHLRGGHVARGGIRWSDRPDDFRTEVLGLMKTQMVKNAVIVPVGSKGGFIVKRPKPGEEGAQEIRECYSTLMRGLLELTDNIVRGQVVSAPAVRYDGDDPYLVVAADKGTATFSDLANSIAAEFGFWLGDAFASGGTHGYDHKKEGITARGAWECIRRHFRELGRDIQTEPFTVAGIGDMSGDVFGNGMLLSRKIRLRAAFNHLHVFLDPDPDPEASFRERERLFRLPRSSWTDYDRKLLSPGGMIVARGAKAAPLSPEVRALLGVEATELDGDGLVRALLAMETDLLFNGGIGTYVRATVETDTEVGDHANDAVRRTAADIRAAVVGEGGNLGFTQRARIEFALRGGRINTDAIDNSGGVDLSDHEVNLKILFQPLLESGEMTLAQRNRALEQVKAEVIDHVLSHNARQSLLLSLDQLRSATRLVEFRDHLTDLEQDGSLDRALENLPDRETLRLRRSSFRGLTRPELAVLAAYSKLRLQRDLLASTWIGDPVFERTLFAYFPKAVVERFPEAVRGHRLRREIIAAELGNQVIDRMGLAFAQRMLRDTAADAPSAVAAWVVVMELTEADRLFDQIAAAPIRTDEAYALCLRWERDVESACKLLIGMLRRPGSLAERIASWRRSLSQLADSSAGAGPSEAVAEVGRLEQAGLAPGIARWLVALDSLRSELEIIRIADDRSLPLGDVAAVYRRVAGVLDFVSLDQWFDAVPGDDRWEKRAAEGLREDLSAARRRMTAAVLERPGPAVDARFAAFVAEHEADMGRLRALIEDLRNSRKMSVAGMVVIARELWKVAGRS